MREKLKNILNLSKVFIRENENNLKLINDENKINKKSLIFWVYVILFFAIFFLSSKIIDYTIKIGKPQISLNVFLLFLEILIIIRTIMVSMNVFYFSKDIENILYLPVRPVEILIAKFNTILFMNYEIEAMFALVPLLVYGIYTHVKLGFFINTILVLAIFPIFSILIVSILIIFLMKTIKLFKNKDLMQLIISFILIFIMMFFANKSVEYVFNNTEYIAENPEILLNNINGKIIQINKYFLSVNPTANILQENNLFKILFNYLKLIFINLIAILLFIFLGNKLYLKQLLKANFYFKRKKNIKIKLNKKSKKNKIGISYVKKEFKLLIKNPMFFIQSIYPVILITIMVLVLLIVLVPVVKNVFQREEFKEDLENLEFNIEAVCLIVGGIQIVGLFNYSSITAFSREGKNAYFMKVLPISMYKQFIYKNIPQILINEISAIIVCIVIYFQIPTINIKYIFILVGLSFLLFLINSFILTLIDLLMPKLEWDAEYEILKNNKNKLLQYVLIVINILFLMGVNRVFEKYNLDISLGVLALILFLFFTSINFYILKNKNKLFKKIN